MQRYESGRHEAAGTLVRVYEERRYLLGRLHLRQRPGRLGGREHPQGVRGDVLLLQVEHARKFHPRQPFRDLLERLFVQVLEQLRARLRREQGEHRLALGVVEAVVEVRLVRRVQVS